MALPVTGVIDNVQHRMRLFLALQLNEELKDALNGIQCQMRRRDVRGNYTPYDNLHLTLAFIGDFNEPDDVLNAVSSVRFSPIPLILSGIGCFGDLWWAGIEPCNELDELVRRIRHVLADAGIPFDRKRFSPHITLIRKASGRLPAISVPHIRMSAESVSLMRSDRGKSGMIYTEIGRLSCS